MSPNQTANTQVEALRHDLEGIVNEGVLPDGDVVSVSVAEVVA